MQDQGSRGGYLDIDEFTNSLDYLKKAALFLENFDDSFRWKWATNCLTNALYGLSISVLTGGNYELVIDWDKLPAKYKKAIDRLPDDNTTATYQARQSVTDEYLNSGKARLIGFETALDRIQRQECMPYDIISQPIAIHESALTNIKRLRRVFRNRFEHFIPMGWSIEQLYFLPMLRDVNRTIKQLLEKNSCISNDDSARNEARSVVINIEQLLDRNEEMLSQ